MSANRKFKTLRRGLSDEERQLWHKVTRTLAPLRSYAKQEAQDDHLDPARSSTVMLTNDKSAGKAKALAPPAKSQVSAIDRKTRHKISRGGNAIDATLDLHGMRQSEAHAALRRFLASAQHRGARFVVVITGKGDRNAGPLDEERQRGVLRAAVPHWLETGELAPFVVAFGEAARHHGGAGAIYIQIRKQRRLASSSGSNAGPKR